MGPDGKLWRLARYRCSRSLPLLPDRGDAPLHGPAEQHVGVAAVLAGPKAYFQAVAQTPQRRLEGGRDLDRLTHHAEDDPDSPEGEQLAADPTQPALGAEVVLERGARLG